MVELVYVVGVVVVDGVVGVVGGLEKFQMTNLTMPNNFSFMKYAEKSGPGLADVGVPHGDGDGPRTPPRWLEGSGKSFK